MKVLITGGNGFIAKNLYEQLEKECSLFSRNSSELNLLDEEATFEYIAGNRFDIIIHAATYDAAPKHSTKDPLKVLENNLKMFFNLARCENYFGKMIYFGSGAEFSREHWKPKMKEDYFDKHVPIDQYGFSKYIMTKYSQMHPSIINLRLFGVFGKYDDWRTRFISNACCHAVLNVPIKINQNVVFDHLYVDDLTKIVQWFMENNPRHNSYNVCSGVVYDFKTLAKKIMNVSGKNVGITINKEGMGKEYSGDNSLLLKEINGFRFTPIDVALRALYEWHEKNRHIISDI